MEYKKQLIDANDVYSLFDVNGMARLHVGDIDVIPRADAIEVVHGQWENNEYGFQCSECMCDSLYDGFNHPIKSQYCPACGAKMDGV